MDNILRGKTWKYENDVDTDVIIPARYLNTSEPSELAEHCMEDIDKTIKASGISVIIAKTFARIFFRNSINIGLPILEHPTFPDECSKGDEIEVNLEAGTIKNLTTGKEYTCNKFPAEIQNLINEGGLVNYTAKKLGVR